MLTLMPLAAVPAAAQEILPFPPKASGGTAGRTMQESIYSALPPVNHLPKDAPNILVVLIDDVGPAQTDTYGGEIHTPTLSKIANAGISYNRFHTTAMCSPTRAALLPGRNHHRVGNGQIGELANDWDGYTGIIPSAPLIFTANDCLDFGIDLGSPVRLEYYDQAPFKFNGKIEGARVQYLNAPRQLQEEKLQTHGAIPAQD